MEKENVTDTSEKDGKCKVFLKHRQNNWGKSFMSQELVQTELSL